MKKIMYFIRHGETEYNKKHIVQGGGIDSDLNEKGREQAALFYQKYQSIPFEVVLTSKLKRTHQTAELFIEKGIPWEQFSEVNEMDWGKFEGKKATPKMHRVYKKLAKDWKAGIYTSRIEGGENALELQSRLEKFIQHLKSRKEELLLVCIHGRVMRALMCLLDGNELSQMDNYQHRNTGLYLVDYQNDQFQIIKRNDATHLKKTNVE